MPCVLPIRRILPRIWLVFTARTRTLKISSTARLTSILLARSATSNTYWPASLSMVLFSVITGRRSTSYVSIASQLQSIRSDRLRYGRLGDLTQQQLGDSLDGIAVQD